MDKKKIEKQAVRDVFKSSPFLLGMMLYFMIDTGFIISGREHIAALVLGIAVAIMNYIIGYMSRDKDE